MRADEETIGLWRFDDIDEKGEVRDASGQGDSGVIRIFPRESLPMNWNGGTITLVHRH